MKKALLALLLAVGLTQVQAADDRPFLRVGLIANQTTAFDADWADFNNNYSATISLATFRLDSSYTTISAYNSLEFPIAAGFGLFIATGASTSYAALDTWTLKVPVGVCYTLSLVNVFVEYVPTFAAFTAGGIGDFSYTDGVNVGLRLNF